MTRFLSSDDDDDDGQLVEKALRLEIATRDMYIQSLEEELKKRDEENVYLKENNDQLRRLFEQTSDEKDMLYEKLKELQEIIKSVL